VTDTNKTNGWNEWAKKVLSDLEEQKKDIGKLYEAITETKIEIAILKTKAIFYGTVGGIIGTVIAALIINFITRGIR